VNRGDYEGKGEEHYVVNRVSPGDSRAGSVKSGAWLSVLLSLFAGGAMGENAVARLAETDAAAASPVLVLSGRVELPGYHGDFDHFAVDLGTNRLFLAAEDHSTLEVFDLKTVKHLRTVGGFATPHSIFPLPQLHQLLLTDGSESVKRLDERHLTVVGSIKLHPGADSIGYDASSNHLYVVTGGKDVKLAQSWLSEIDPVSGEELGSLLFNADHVEAMAIEQHGPHLYINVTARNELDMIDKTTRSILARWPIREARQNALVQLDERMRRLFVVTRDPARMIVLNADTGASIASFDAPGHVDGEIFDAANRRVYAAGGEGYIGVYQEQDAGPVVEMARVPSAVGAKTAILVPELHRLYLAVSPGDGSAGGAVMWFDVKPRG
jgi:DNA-binding beta-propeller fold protein YncE